MDAVPCIPESGMAKERRARPREKLSLPVVLADGSTAVTHDISEDGLYLIAPSPARMDDWLSLEFAVPHAGVRFVAAGRVIRTDRGAQVTGFALRLHGSRLAPID